VGNASWSNDAYKTVRSQTSTKSADQIFTNTLKNTIDKTMAPANIVMRESRDSVEHPNSVAAIVGLDETGSMGSIPVYLIKNSLGTLMETIIGHGVPDAQLMFIGLGDHFSDSYPLQVGQFESGTDEITKSLMKINLEGNGGGNGGESYFLTWLLAGRYTSIDCFEKRGAKGFIFTIGDEPCHSEINVRDQQKIFGKSFESTVTAEQALAEAQRMYHVYHIHVNEGSYKASSIQDNWKKLLNENFLVCEDKDKISEIIATTIAVVNGADMQSVLSKFDAKTAGVVGNALMHLNNTTAVARNTTSDQGVMVL
jgi:hypothetical protein